MQFPIKNAQAQPIPFYPTTNTTTINAYTVVAGDTLSSIGLQYDRSINAIADYNNIVDPNILQIGQIVNIPPVNYVVKIKNNISLQKSTNVLAPANNFHASVSYPSSNCYGLSGPELWVVQQESRCESNATNGQYHGLGQLAGETSANPQQQINDINAYVIARYGSWQVAWNHEKQFNWY